MAAKKRTSKTKAAAKQAARRQLTAIILFAVGILLTGVAMIPGDRLWLGMHNVLLGLFSWVAYLVGPLVIYIAVLITMDNPNLPYIPRAWQSALLVLLICGAVQVFAPQPGEGNLFELIKELYQGGIEFQGGGVFGAALGLTLYALFGFWGAAITMLLLIFVFVMLITGATLAGVLRSAKRPVEKISETYLDIMEERRQKPKFNIDIPLDGEKVKATTAAAPVPVFAPEPETVPAGASAKEKLLAAAMGEQVGPQVSIIPPAQSRKEEPAPVQEEEDSWLDAIVSRAVAVEPEEPHSASSAAQAQEAFQFNEEAAAEAVAAPPKPVYSLPPINLLDEVMNPAGTAAGDELKLNAERLVDTLKSFGVQTRVVDISRGPAVTRYELQPSAGVKISRITGLADDIALNLAAAGVRIEAPIPNKAAVGIEVPNKVVSTVSIREIIDSPKYSESQSRLTVALGKDIAGNVTVADLGKMPHMLIAGSTGSGKSVCINSLIISLLYKSTPDQVKLLMIDPKMVELGGYNGIPHLLVPVVTDPKKAAGALCWAVGEMLKRYKLFGDNNVRDLSSYNRLVENREGLERLPEIVIIIDELADLMMAAPRDVEDYICRLAQMARAAGMHLVIATQRPSVDVITGVIKANIPSRIAFAVSSQVDSRTILDMGGAEKLLGRGDMLFYPVGASKPVRVQGCFVNDKEVERVVAFVKEGETNEYNTEIIEEIDRQAANTGKGGGGSSSGGSDSDDGEDDEMLMAAIECVVEAGQASTSLLQRRLKLGYARAARIVDEMEQRGIVGAYEGSKPRQVLISKERWYEMKLNKQG